MAVHLLRMIANSYYIGSERYHEALERLIHAAGADGDSVVLCRWQPSGHSADRVAHDIKNQAAWRATTEIDLREQQTWNHLRRNASHTFVVADDFVGSGKSMQRLCTAPGYPIQTLLDKFPRARVLVLVVAAFQHGIEPVLNAASPYADRFKTSVGILFRNQDRCFTPVSRIISDREQQNAVKRACRDVASKYMPTLPSSFLFGYDQTGALVVFETTVPNNTLPMFWYDAGSWVALFPASGLVEQ